MSGSTRRITTTSAAAVLAVAVGFAGSSALSAQAEAPTKKPGLTKAKVTKIAQREATKQVLALAPTLSVASAKTATSAQTAVSAQSAQTAVAAQTAATAVRLANAEVRTFGTDVGNNAAGVVLGTVSGLTLTATCPANVPTIVATAAGGKIRFDNTDNATPAVVQSGGNSALTTSTVTNAMGLGTGTLAYRSPSNQGLTAWYGWRQDAANTCSFFGTMLGS